VVRVPLSWPSCRFEGLGGLGRSGSRDGRMSMKQWLEDDARSGPAGGVEDEGMEIIQYIA
jgi:hypothetical protein